jgi:hypothetical protein
METLEKLFWICIGIIGIGMALCIVGVGLQIIRGY